MDRARRIAIVGGGPAGLTAALALQDAGFSHVTVLEAAEDLGGKCYSLEVKGEMHEMGAVLISPGYTETLKLVERFDEPLIKGPEMWAIDLETGEKRLSLSLNEEASEGLTQEESAAIALTYLSELRRNKKHVGKAGYVNTPEEIAQPFAPWAKERGIEALVDVFRVPLTCFGYGYLDVTPAAYVMKNMNRKNFLTAGTTTSPWPKTFKNGYQGFMRSIGASLQDVRLGARVTEVKRGEHVEITYEQGGEPHTLIADEIILAVPLDNEGGLGFMDLREDEQALFSKVNYYNYSTIAIHAPGLEPKRCYSSILSKGSQAEPPETLPCLFARPHESTDVAIFYANAAEGDGLPEIEAALYSSMEALGIEVGEILARRMWRYFPHVSSEDMAAGFFDDVESLQGVGNTYYTGGQLDFDIVEGAVSYSMSLIKRHFL